MEREHPMMNIREATEEDSPAIANLLAELGYPVAAAEIPARLVAAATAQGQVLVAEYESEVVGVAAVLRVPFLHRPQPTAILGTLVVQADHRGLGIGRALVDAATRQAAAWGCAALELTSRDERVQAHQFYTGLGFESLSRKFARAVAG